MQRTGIWAAMLVLAVLAFARLQTARGEFNLTADQMKAALRTATVEEQGFIDKVLFLVQRGILPEDLVESTFLWAERSRSTSFNTSNTR